MKLLPGIVLCMIGLAPIPARSREQRTGTLPRAVVTDFFNSSKDRHTIMLRTAPDTLAKELAKAGAYEVVSRQEIDRTAVRLKLTGQLSDEDFAAVAKEVGAALLVIGEIRHVEWRVKDRAREVEIGVIVRVRDIETGEFLNGAAERGTSSDLPGGKKTDGLMLVDAADSAVYRAAARIAAYRPIEGTILNTAGRGMVIMNRGSGHGVRGKQEFIVFRSGTKVGRLKVFQALPSYSEMTVVENTLGVRPEDKAIAVFPEPKFGR